MPSLLDLRRRIRAVKSTQQITKAMKMISASKLRRAQERVVGARPFALQMQRVLNSLASRVDPSTHPLLAEREDGAASKVLLIVVTADKGLCGGFNTNIIKAAGAFIGGSGLLRAEASGASGAPGSKIVLGLVGRKGRDFFKRRGFEVRIEEIGIFQRVRYADARRIAEAAIEEFTSGRVNRVFIVYNEFKSVMQQRVTTEQLLPIPKLGAGSPGQDPADVRRAGPSGPAGGHAPVAGDIDYIYEPDPARILGDLLPKHIEIQIYRALLESAAAEHAARMTAMDAATKNSAEIIENLTLYMNKVRQAAITREIIEVVSGAQAL
ncbi:MAG: ATP synthase F1 subunit gamma [Acidobacteria bacterium]|nr:MAG: ATP synthase F1 subunit gamma [Acidobacteriota bacterium]